MKYILDAKIFTFQYNAIRSAQILFRISTDEKFRKSQEKNFYNYFFNFYLKNNVLREWWRGLALMMARMHQYEEYIKKRKTHYSSERH